MTEEELIDYIDNYIKKNSTKSITGTQMNVVLKAVIQLINDSGGVTNWGDIEGTLADQLDLKSALDAKQNLLGYAAENLANKGSANGYAPLNSSSKIESIYLPSYVDDVIEVADFVSLPATGESGKIYVTLDTNLTYRWSGSAYVEISASLALGETSSTAYRGDRGKIGYDHSQVTGNPHLTTATNVDALKRDGSNANSDIDVGTYAVNAKSFKANGTSGNGHFSMKHQSAGISAAASESAFGADSSGNPIWKNDGNAQQKIMLENASDITPGTFHKVTVDAKGRVTAGEVSYGLLSGNPNTSNATTGGTARYITFSEGNVQNTYNSRQVLLVQDCTVKKFYIVTTTSQPASGSSVFTVLKNGEDTGIVITIAAGSASGTYSETSTEVSFSASDTISVKWVNNASATSCTIACLSIGLS